MKFQWVIFVVIKQRLFIIKWGNSTRVAVMLNELDATVISCSNAVGDYKQAARLDWFGIRGMSSHFCPAERDHPFAFLELLFTRKKEDGLTLMSAHVVLSQLERRVSSATARHVAGPAKLTQVRMRRLARWLAPARCLESAQVV
jgi:hypothetical protein